jgi:uncharacterized protein (DUF488 family)
MTPDPRVMQGDRTVWTVGHSDRRLDELVALLRSAGVRRLVDVRSYPTSRLPWFERSALKSGLADHGVDYLWLGRDLGGLRAEEYRAWMTTERYDRGLVELERAAAELATAVGCAERDPERCHRRFIADTLVDRGWRVVHLLGPDDAVTHIRRPHQDGLPF